MHIAALLLVGLSISAVPLELERDVHEIQTPKFALPLWIDPRQTEEIAKIRLYVSQDRGKTWKHVSDHMPSDEELVYSAPQDGLYWFALQVVMKDGKKEPQAVKNLSPSQKVYVNTKRKALKPQKSYEALLREVEQLRKEVAELKRKLAERELPKKDK
jgi:hypothetical protein